jgi:hypothetical protein
MADQFNKVYACAGNLQTWNLHCHLNRPYAIGKAKMRRRRSVNQVAGLAAGELDAKGHCTKSAGQLSEEIEVLELVR